MHYTVHSITQAVYTQGWMAKSYGTIKKTTRRRECCMGSYTI